MMEDTLDYRTRQTLKELVFCSKETGDLVLLTSISKHMLISNQTDNHDVIDMHISGEVEIVGYAFIGKL